MYIYILKCHNRVEKNTNREDAPKRQNILTIVNKISMKTNALCMCMLQVWNNLRKNPICIYIYVYILERK